MMPDSIPATFVTYAAGILADTQSGLTGTQIVEICSAFAFDHSVDIPHHTYPFDSPNKRTALRENIMAFKPAQQYQIIKALCEDERIAEQPKVRDLKIKLLSRFSDSFGDSETDKISAPLVEETKHWLEDYTAAYRSYTSAEQKYHGGVFSRNLLDDLRLSLELLLKEILQSPKSLENQQQALGSFLAKRGGSKELRNMFLKLIDYYGKYQNSYVKHDDAVVEEEIEILFEITSSFIKHLIRVKDRS
jgi:hypothetical protein